MKDKLNALRVDIDKALVAVAKKHKLKSLQCKPGATYGTARCEFKIEGLDADGMSVEAERYKLHEKLLKLKPLGSPIEISGRVYTSTGLNSTGTKVYATQAVTNKEYLIPVSQFKVNP